MYLEGTSWLWNFSSPKAFHFFQNIPYLFFPFSLWNKRRKKVAAGAFRCTCLLEESDFNFVKVYWKKLRLSSTLYNILQLRKIAVPWNWGLCICTIVVGILTSTLMTCLKLLLDQLSVSNVVTLTSTWYILLTPKTPSFWIQPSWRFLSWVKAH